MMIKALVVGAMVFMSFPIFGQQSVPIFVDKRDSVEYAMLMIAMQEVYRNPQFNQISRTNMDSLMRLQSKLRDKIIGYKIIYKADKEFTPYEDLKNAKIRPEQILKLSFSDSKSTSLPREVFLCSNLAELELVNTSVKKLPAKLSKLSRLQSIYIYNNVLPSGKLKLGRNKNIVALVIRGVNSQGLPGSYKRFISLDTLDLSRNINMTSFPDIYKNRKLKKLNIFENNLTLIDLKSGSNLSLEELNIQRNRIKVVPETMGSFSKLKKLTFNYNEIAEVKPGIGNLKDLEALSFYQNKLQTVPAGIFQLSSLKSIDLYFNQLQVLDPEISKLKNLRILYLSNNRLTTLPENLGDLSNLVELYLHDNKIEHLPESLSQLTKLRVLRVNDNLLTAFPDSVLSLKELENLDLSRNYLYRFPTELSALTRIKILGIVGNPWENKDDVERVAESLRSRGVVCVYSK